MRWKSLHAQTTSRTSWVYSLLASLCAFMPFLYHTKQKTTTHTFHHYVFSLVTSLHSQWRFQTWEVAFSYSFHKLEALLAAGPVNGVRNRIQLNAKRVEESEGIKEKGREKIVGRRCGRSGSKGQFGGVWGWALGSIIPITCSTVSCSVDGCGLNTHSTLDLMSFLMVWFSPLSRL